AYTDTLFFPAGDRGFGWLDTGVFLEDLMDSVSQQKNSIVREETSNITVSNA
ncbi:hypothetical protein MKX03_016966, partial [Papaver bracteatum]